MKDHGDRLAVACQSLEGSKGGIARVCELTARVAFEAGYPLSLRSVETEGGSFQNAKFWRGYEGSRIAFVLGCLGPALKGERILYDQLGTARAHALFSHFAKPCGTWIHGIEVWDELRRDRLKAAGRMKFMLANSHFTRQHAAGYDKIFASAHVCWLATAEDDPPPTPASLEGPPVVMIVGRLDNAAYKGHKELIEAWPEVTDAVPEAELVIVGIGPSLEKHRSLAAGSRASRHINVTGFESDSALAERWKKTTIFAMPSRGEGFGLTYIEAMRWGIPVIASTHDAGQEVNIHGLTGLNVDLDRKNALRDALIELLRDRTTAVKMGAAGRERWRANFRYSAFRTRFMKELEYFCRL